VRKKIEARLTLGDVGLLDDVAKPPTFSEYAETWINITIPATCKHATESDYRTILNKHVLPVFADTPVPDITRFEVKKFLAEKSRAGLAPSTVGHMKSAIAGVLSLAVDDNVLQGNPAHRLGKVIRPKQVHEEIDPLTRDELGLLLSVCKEHFPAHYPMALTLARTGIRLGEVITLQWGDIDFHGRFINVRRNLSRGKIQTPKNGKSRKIDMSQQLTATLKELRHARKLEAIKKGWGGVPEFVFVNESGYLLDKNNWRKRVFYRVLEKAGLRQIRVHDLRHTFASLLIQAGESLAYVRDQLGHHSIKVTVDIYGHLAPGGNKAAVDRLDDEVDATIRNPSATTNKNGVGHAS
jgi:integrase